MYLLPINRIVDSLLFPDQQEPPPDTARPQVPERRPPARPRPKPNPIQTDHEQEEKPTDTLRPQVPKRRAPGRPRRQHPRPKSNVIQNDHEEEEKAPDTVKPEEVERRVPARPRRRRPQPKPNLIPSDHEAEEETNQNGSGDADELPCPTYSSEEAMNAEIPTDTVPCSFSETELAAEAYAEVLLEEMKADADTEVPPEAAEESDDSESSEPELKPKLEPSPNDPIIGSCPNCSKTFTMRRWLLAHKFKCTKNQPAIYKPKRKYFYKTSKQNSASEGTEDGQSKPRRYFQCDQYPCTRLYRNKQGLTKHLVTFHKLGKEAQTSQCPHCPKIFPNVHRLQGHVRIMHNLKKSSLVCPHCSNKFLEEYNLNRHLRINKVENKLPIHCPHCNKGFNYRCTYKKHVKFQCDLKPESNLSLPCPDCPKTFPSVKSLSHHKYWRHVAPSIPNPPCEFCGKQFSNAMGLRKHVRTFHRPGGPKKWPCQYCGLEFSGPTNLKRHIQFSFGQTKDVTRLDCKQCGLEFLLKCQAKHHFRDQECEECRLHFTCEQMYSEHRVPNCTQKEFPYARVIKSISKVKVTEGGYPCVKCCKIYPNFVSWRIHSYIHDDEERGTTYPCPVQGCGKVFKGRPNLNNHKRNYHTGKSYTCDYCGLNVKHRANFKRHVELGFCKMGKDERRTKRKAPRQQDQTYNCTYCGHLFKSYKRNLDRHLKLMLPKREGVKFSCLNCHAKFDARCALRKHEKECTNSDSENENSIQRKTLTKVPIKPKSKKVSTSEKPSISKQFSLVCPHCQLKFGRLVALKRHLDVNRNHRESKCSNCDEIFEFKCKQAKHICSSSSDSDSEELEQEPAEETSPTMDDTRIIKTESISPEPDPVQLDTRNSNTTISSEVGVPDPGGPFYCWACNVAFDRKQLFFSHIRIFHQEEPE